MTQSPRRGGGDTRTRILEAGLDLIAEEGLGALTHRAVESRAGVSHGSTTYYFRSREAMVEALLEHLVAVEDAAVASVPQVLPEPSAPATPEAAAARAPEWWLAVQAATELHLGRRRDMMARHELFLYAARKPHLRNMMRRHRDHFVDSLATAFEAWGAPNPRPAALWVLTTMEGLGVYQLSVPDVELGRWAPTLVGQTMYAGLSLREGDGPWHRAD